MKLTPRAGRGPRYWLKLLLFAIVTATLFYFGLIVWFQVRPTASAVTVTPADWGADFETLALELPDGVRLAGWYIPAQNGAAVILLHGYGSSRMNVLFQAEALSRHGFGVLAYDQRASGESEGRWRTWGAQDVLDLETMLAYLQARPEVDPERIGVFGHSTGAEIALHAAARYPALRAVVADGPGWSAPSDFRPRNLRERFLHSPAPLVLGLIDLVSGSPGTSPLLEAAPQIAPRPLLLISAGTDIERYQAELYLEAAGATAEHWNIPEAQHGGGPASRPVEYEEKLVAFFTEALPGGNPGE